MNRPLNATDAALWDIERDPTLRTTIVAVLHLEHGVDRERLLNDLEAATRTMPKLRQRVVAGPAGIGTPHWELLQNFDISDHVTFINTEDPVEDDQITAMSGELASSQLDRSGALWQCTHLSGSSGPAALIFKVHHSLTDGVGGFELLDAILDADRDAPPRELEGLAVPQETGAIHPFIGTTVAAQKLIDLQFDLAKYAANAALHPVDAASGAWQGLQSTLRLLSPTSPAVSTLMTGRSADRKTHAFDIDLDQMHRAAHKHGCTVNQLFFAGAVEGIAEYHRQAHHELEGLRVLMPVSFRATEDPTTGNQWGPVRFTAPAAIEDHVERLCAMRTVLTRSAKEPALGFSQTLAGVVQLLPSVFSSSIVSGMMHGVDVVLTNIPGLQEDRFICGSRVERVYGFAPTAGAAVNIALVSHGPHACIGILSDVAAVEDPDRLRELIETSLHDVMTASERADATPFIEPSPPPKPVEGPPQRLSALDTAFLELETPEAPMHLGGVFTFDGGPLRNPDGSVSIEIARRHIEARLAQLPNFRRKLAEIPLGLGRPLWVDDEHFDISRHVRLTSVPHPGGHDELLELAATLHETPLDRNHPLWEIWFVDGLANHGVAIVKKVHHALVDGLGAIELVTALFDFTPQSAPDLPVHVPTRSAPTSARRLADAALEQLADPFRLARSTAKLVVSTPDKAVEQAKSLTSAARDLLRPGAVVPAASFNQPLERRRSLRSVAVPLDRVHEVRHPLGATVNDVVLAAIAGAFHNWLPLHGDDIFDVHAIVPVSVRHAGINDEPGNRVGAVLLTLPVGEPDQERRIRLVRDRMSRLKASHDGEGLALALDALDHVPARSLRAARLLSMQRMANLVITNVPGPPQPMYFLDAELTEMVPILPLGPNFGLGLAITSYTETLTIGMLADPDLCPDLGDFAELLAAEFAG